MRRFLGSLVAVGLLRVAFGWLATGHELIGEVAWQRLSPKAKVELGAILMAGDTDFRPQSDKEEDVRVAFRKATTWADWIKGSKQGQYEPEIESWNKRFQPGFDPKEGGEAVRCKRWHYFDTPVKFKGPVPGVESSNALVAMTVARLEFERLAAAPVPDRRGQCWWLYWLEHVVGDLHQPLHCVSSYADDPSGDAGGNRFLLAETPDGKKQSLHFFWDRGIEDAIALEPDGARDLPTVAARWIQAYPPTEQDLHDLDFAHWIAEGAKLAETVAYEGVEKGSEPSAEYKARTVELCRQRAVLAGTRLAELINAAWR